MASKSGSSKADPSKKAGSPKKTASPETPSTPKTAASSKQQASSDQTPSEPLSAESLPADISAALVKGVGAYLRQSAQLDLPTKLRRFRGFTDKSLMRHAAELLAVLDDDAQRALIVQWLDDGKPALAKATIAILAIAARREDGWDEALRARSRAGDVSATGKTGDDPDRLGRAVERERAKTTKAKDELRRLRDESTLRIKERDSQVSALSNEVAGLQTQLVSAEKRANDAERRATKAEEMADREVRRARKDADEAARLMGRLKDEARLVRKEADGLRTELARATATPKKRAPQRSSASSAPKGPRKALAVPKGRYEDAPETLGEWLGAPNVHLVVDGYNVTKAEGGFGDLALEAQRERLIDEVMKLARRQKVGATIVFDGSDVSPRTTRAKRGSVKVEYSKDEIADDHIVALLEQLPAHPVILATNDRELQDRARATGATIATSPQLLALLH